MNSGSQPNLISIYCLFSFKILLEDIKCKSYASDEGIWGLKAILFAAILHKLCCLQHSQCLSLPAWRRERELFSKLYRQDIYCSNSCFLQVLGYPVAFCDGFVCQCCHHKSRIKFCKAARREEIDRKLNACVHWFGLSYVHLAFSDHYGAKIVSK